MERNASRFALTQALSAGPIGAGARNVNMAATAVQVTTPKASRTTPEAFATTLGRGLAQQHSVLPMRPASLRLLKKVDTIVIDPRVLVHRHVAGGAYPRRRRERTDGGMEPRPAHAGETQHPPGLARGARDVW